MALLSKFCKSCGVKLTEKNQSKSQRQLNSSVCSKCTAIDQRELKTEFYKRLETQPTRLDPHLWAMMEDE